MCTLLILWLWQALLIDRSVVPVISEPNYPVQL